jgi:hypothetical protein
MKVNNLFFKTNNLNHLHSYKLRNLNNTLTYGNNGDDICGEFYLEVLDPAHRWLDYWRHLWDNSSKKYPFFTSLEYYNIPPNAVHTKFLYNEDLNKTKIMIKNGYIFLSNKLFSSPDVKDRYNESLFIIDSDLNIYIAFSDSHTRHISLSHGRPTVGGGVLEVRNGIITHIDGSSGHYLYKTYEILQTINVFINKGIKLSKNVKITNWSEDNQRETLFLSEFIKKYRFYFSLDCALAENQIINREI